MRIEITALVSSSIQQLATTTKTIRNKYMKNISFFIIDYCDDIHNINIYI